MKVKRICPIHGLYTKDSNAKTGCPQCKKTQTKVYDKDYRDKENDKFYHSREWKRVRRLQLSKFPLCKECLQPAVIVDHIQEIKDGGAKLSLKNLQSLCRSCHNIKTIKEKQSRLGGSKSLQTKSTVTDSYPYFSQSSIRGGGV